MLFNASLLGLVVVLVNAKFAGIDNRFDDIRDLWRAELRRVEEVLDARLKHIAEATWMNAGTGLDSASDKCRGPVCERINCVEWHFSLGDEPTALSRDRHPDAV